MGKGVEIDHFVPWARYPDNGIDNLVVAHRRCNHDKRDFLAAFGHVEKWVARMAPHTKHYHIEDIAASREHAHLIPGQGAIDLAATLDAIRQTDYDGWITVELYPYIDDPDLAGREAMRYLESL